uniref:Uncharacterized protein n=1 Tax=Rhizophora mucronata TaxID=61149 RepID=A0A2P2P933_RHIMU
MNCYALPFSISVIALHLALHLAIQGPPCVCLKLF